MFALEFKLENDSLVVREVLSRIGLSEDKVSHDSGSLVIGLDFICVRFVMFSMTHICESYDV